MSRSESFHDALSQGGGPEMLQDLGPDETFGPVTDWATDFDHTAPGWAADPYPIWEELRATCPIAHSARFGGVWLPTRHADVSSIAHDQEQFTSRSVVVAQRRPPAELAPAGISPPISSDPPFHRGARRVLMPAFSPSAIAALEPMTRAYCDELLDGLAGRDRLDAATQYAQHIPVRVISNMLGFPLSDGDVFRGFVHEVLEGVTQPLEERMDAFTRLFEYLSVQIQDHVDHPRDDLTSFLIDATIDGEQLDWGHIGGSMALLLIAGIDTTWSAIGASIWHLADHPDDLRRIVEDRSMLPVAMEEFLRAYAPVTMARLVKDDMDWNGCPMHKDDWVLLSFPSANRDPEAFSDADKVVIDRAENRHAAFGLGIHRCVGSHLARMELRVALEAWLDRYPAFSLADPSAVTWSGGQVRGPRTLPVTIGSAPA
jgi:cytochrome P450